MRHPFGRSPACATRPLMARALALLFALALAHGRAAALDPGTPEDVLTRYLTALKAQKFEDVYPLISTAMRGGKDRDTYVKQSKALMQFADVKIFDFRVGKAKIEDGVAKVPNVLESQDRFANTLGLTEYELYTLVREDGQWKVDSQILLEPPEVPKWFPGAAPKPDAAASH
jgi:hypothetical protein